MIYIGLTAKQARFVDEYLIDLNATAAARRAGYATKNADRIGPELLGKTCVQQAIQKRMQERSQRTQITQDEILRDLVSIKDHCMDEEFYDAKNAIKALELCGKHLGMFTDKLKTDTTETITIKWQT